MTQDIMEKLVALAKRRGIIFPGSEIYGGLAGTWDLGPIGVLLARNIKNEWLKAIVGEHDNIVELDSSILLNPKVWEASGHIESFTDPLVECKVCHARFREDHKDLIEAHVKTHKEKGLPADRRVEWTSPKQFNLMFKTFIGPIDAEENTTYLRPETAQGIFINFKNVLDTSRQKIPFGIAQIGKGFRNEITTGNFLFRVREFEMMELEYFVEPEKASEVHEQWKEKRLKWYQDLGIQPENIKLIDLPKEDLSHYSKGTAEVHYNWPFMDWGELEGIANRGDYDLVQHEKASGRDMKYFDQEKGEKFHPYVIEPSVGLGRAMLAFLIDAYHEEEKRVVLRLHPRLAPYKVAVFPLLANKEQLVGKARDVFDSLKNEFAVTFDGRGNIGKRYLAQDEIGTPFCVTIDFDTLEDNTVTVRDRDTAQQERVKIDDLKDHLSSKLT